VETQLWDAADAMAWFGQGCPSSASYRSRLQSEANGDDPTNHDSVMTDFDRTSNSETANILSASRDWLPVIVQTHPYENLKPRTGLLSFARSQEAIFTSCLFFVAFLTQCSK